LKKDTWSVVVIMTDIGSKSDLLLRMSRDLLDLLGNKKTASLVRIKEEKQSVREHAILLKQKVIDISLKIQQQIARK
jgi:hypothetical protein